MDPTTPNSLNEAIATEPVWLQAWVMILVATNLAALLFAVRRENERWRFRAEPLAIVFSFLAAAVFMGWLYERVGYVRLLGLAHVLFWGPVWFWIFRRRRAIGTHTVFGKYVRLYLAIAGASLVIDTLDVIRYFVGDGQLLHRWG